ncbi:hypothetical protein [Actinomycetospora cinnamomea]|uniref:Uncharacterized protein n=1 Tax=Actinomycetospora cinnamomea TaxID=663609 RepID=A0A2U1EXX4_9PSEU|nr:hypothetical protein [Actinomycetospora cinnamomea]PVZ04590.1 hypothetical protein C8D89_11743 [Actinomycetospora cinnamomea]
MTQRSRGRATARPRRTVLSVTSALVALVLGVSVGAGHDGHSLAVILVVLLVPAAAVWVPTRRLEPLPRAVLTLGAVLVLNTLVAELMLAVGAWSITGGVVVVTGVSVMVWIGLEIGSGSGEPIRSASPDALCLPPSTKEMS